MWHFGFWAPGGDQSPVGKQLSAIAEAILFARHWPVFLLPLSLRSSASVQVEDEGSNHGGQDYTPTRLPPAPGVQQTQQLSCCGGPSASLSHTPFCRVLDPVDT